MRKLAAILCVGLCASPVMAWSFSEGFNTYAPGNNNWGSAGKWAEPTANLRLDSYTADNSLGPRTGNTSLRVATAPLGESIGGPITFSSDSRWEVEESGNDAVFIVLSDSLATAQLVPKTTAGLGSPINAVAWGHVPGGNLHDYGFFDGQNWHVIGQSPATFNTKGRVAIAGSIDVAGAWSVAMSDFTTLAPLGSNNGVLAAGSFAFSEVTIISQGNDSGVYSGVDNINITPEPLSACLLGIGFLFLRRRRA